MSPTDRSDRPGRPQAIVDVGSNSVRLFLCEGMGADGPEGPRLTTITSLKRGAAADGTLADAALDRLDACLADYGARADAAGATTGMALGTSAVRDAPNRVEVARRVAARLGLPLTVLTGDEEAGLAFAGARVAVPLPGSVLVTDPGGASTELVRGGPDTPPATVSVQLGGVRTTEAFLHSDPPSAAEMDVMSREIRRVLTEALTRVGGPVRAGEPVVGVAGTVTTLAAIDAGRYDPAVVHGRVLSRGRVREILSMLAGAPLAERRRVPGLEPARAPAIVGGAAIVLAVLEVAGAEQLTVSERDLLDGAALAAERFIAERVPGAPARIVGARPDAEVPYTDRHG